MDTSVVWMCRFSMACDQIVRATLFAVTNALLVQTTTASKIASAMIQTA